MIQKNVKDELLQHFDRLTPELQQRVLEFAREKSAALRPGIFGRQLIRFAKTISPDDARQMQEAIDAACGQVDPHAW